MSSLLECPANYILEDGARLSLSDVVRHLPGRRLVCRGEYGDTAVYAKLFFGRKGQRDARRDEAGSRSLAAAGVLTPELLYSGRLADRLIAVCVYAAVAGSADAESVLSATSDPAGRAGLMRRLACCVAEHHRAGLMQTDMYLKNFLVAADRIYSLDGDGIRALPRLGRRRAALDNLAVLLSKFDIDDDDAIAMAYASYSEALGQTVQVERQAWLGRRVMWHRCHSVSRYADQKIYRNCTDIEVHASFQLFVATARQLLGPELRALLNHPRDFALRADTCYLKRGNSCTVMAACVDGRNLVIKRYNIKNWWHAIGRLWRPSRAARSWTGAHRLRMYGVKVPQPLALVEMRWGPFRREAYFVAERVMAPDAKAFFRDPRISDTEKYAAALGVARLLNKLLRLRIVHGDMKASNLLLLPNAQPLLLDLDALYETRYALKAKRGHTADLQRWMRNWGDDATIAVIMREALRQVYQDDELLSKAGIL